MMNDPMPKPSVPSVRAKPTPASAAGSAQLERRDVGRVTVLRVRMPMLWDDPATEDLFARIDDVVQNSGQSGFVLDVAAVEFLASAGLGKLASLSRKARAANARLVLCGVAPGIARLLQITHLADVLISFDSEDEAVRALS